jgi:hypothetical protein
MALASLALASCQSGPDELNVQYGHTFVDDAWLDPGRKGAWGIRQSDEDFITLGLTWYLRPREVVVVPSLGGRPLEAKLLGVPPNDEAPPPAVHRDEGSCRRKR